MSKQETLDKMACIMADWSKEDFSSLSQTQFCADMLETMPGKENVLNDEEVETLSGMSDFEIHQAVLELLK